MPQFWNFNWSGISILHITQIYFGVRLLILQEVFFPERPSNNSKPFAIINNCFPKTIWSLLRNNPSLCLLFNLSTVVPNVSETHFKSELRWDYCIWNCLTKLFNSSTVVPNVSEAHFKSELGWDYSIYQYMKLLFSIVVEEKQYRCIIQLYFKKADLSAEWRFFVYCDWDFIPILFDILQTPVKHRNLKYSLQ